MTKYVNNSSAYFMYSATHSWQSHTKQMNKGPILNVVLSLYKVIANVSSTDMGIRTKCFCWRWNRNVALLLILTFSFYCWLYHLLKNAWLLGLIHSDCLCRTLMRTSCCAIIIVTRASSSPCSWQMVVIRLLAAASLALTAMCHCAYLLQNQTSVKHKITTTTWSLLPFSSFKLHHFQTNK